MTTGTPRTDWQEILAPDEDQRFAEYADFLGQAQKRNAVQGRPGRALHIKGQLGARAQFTVLPDLPDYARIGVFQTPATLPAWVRFSGASGRMQKDQAPDVRGFAIKLVGIPGKKLIPGLEHEQTQDFLMITTPATPFPDADQFIAFVRAAQSPALMVPRMIGHFGFFRALGLLKRLLAGASKKIVTLAEQSYYSALPIKFGPYAVHYAVRPSEPAAPPEKPFKSGDYLGDELAARLLRGPLHYDFLVQFYADPAKTPIEDAAVEWREQDAPFVKLARLTLPQQDLRSEVGRKEAAFVESLSFDPWHATEDFRPIGNMMRARQHAYKVSVIGRGAVKEPDGSEVFG